MTEGSPAPVAHPSDIPYELALSAHRWSSHAPERRARQDQEGYAATVNGFHADMLELAETEGQRRVLADEIEVYRQGYIRHYGALLQAESRTASPMITGPANFPVGQNRKRMAAADNRRRELLEWDGRARAAVERKLLEARSPDQKESDAWGRLAQGIRESLDEIRAIDEHGSPYTRASFVNSVVGKVERLALSGEAALVDKSLELVREYNAAHRKPAVSERHKFWSFGELARAKAKEHDAALDEEPSTVVESEGVRIVENKAADRVQIFFPGKPEAAMRDKLKGEGWRFSPTEEAWQRKLTNAAIYSAKKITGLGL